MKSMTCKELGGACDVAFQATTFEEMDQLSQDHGKKMAQKGDKPHLEAMDQMRELMRSEDGMTQWMAEKRRAFEAKAEQPHG